ncbi:cytochrome c [Planctomicrobium sp. SH527]|uniref:cytochrome c n=1 Tax=Planctomicrobium sp. SH527 TaxID=3448123 RepID=UPI003F5B7399
MYKLNFPPAVLVATLSLQGLFLGGCGSKPAPPAAETTPATPAAPATSPAPEASQAPTPAAQPAPAVANTGGKETKWIGTIPYDVFYDQPLVIAANSASTGTVPALPAGNAIAAATTSPTSPSATQASPAMPATPAESMPATPAATPSANAPMGAAANWAEVIPMPILVEEIKLLRTQLTGNLQTVATYNKSFKSISLDSAVLAALAGLAEVHPEALNWKDKAHFVRDLASEISSSASGTGRDAFTKSKEPFDKLTIILDGGKAPEMESKAGAPFADNIYVADMMKRIEHSFTGLKSNFNTPARLKEDPQLIERELRLLTALGTMMTDRSYDSAEEENYQKLANQFIGGTKDALTAAKSGDLEGYQAALNKAQTSCAECHQQYRGNGSSF